MGGGRAEQVVFAGGKKCSGFMTVRACLLGYGRYHGGPGKGTGLVYLIRS